MRAAIILASLLFLFSIVDAVPVRVQPRLLSFDDDYSSSVSVQHQDHPLSKRLYRAQEWYDKPRNLILAVLGGAAVAFGLGAGLQVLMEKKACDYVTKQQHHLQQVWDARHPDGFIPVGGQLRPIDPICQKKLIDLKGQDAWDNY